MSLGKHMLRTSYILGLFAVAGATLLAFTYENTREAIAESERQYLLATLHELVPPDSYNNDLFEDTIQVTSPELLGGSQPLTVYRARKNDIPVAAILTVIAPDGYNGDIKLLVSINLDGSIAGVRAIAHKETPGLGDAIDTRRSDWIHGFDGRSLGNPPEQDWAVKRDGGAFDQLTGATITPRAVVDAVRKALKYFDKHKLSLFRKQ
jgi:electron transport complex protein RnfG